MESARSGLIGRADAIAALTDTIVSGSAITLVGPGGVGKSSLAFALAGEFRRLGRRQVGVVELASVTGPERLAAAVSAALGALCGPSDSAASIVEAWADDEPALVVLDNCEHLGDIPAALVVELLARSPNLAVVATSREPLRLTGEQLYEVLPLSIGGEASDGVQLFVERAKLAKPDFRPTADQMRSIIEIVAWLDGMPLAIEMAASRCRHVALAELAHALHQDLVLLSAEGVDVPRRQRTMQACIEWSFRQLDIEQQEVLVSLSVFEGTFDLLDATAVLSPDRSASEIIALVGELVDRSLLQCDVAGTAANYRMLHTIRTFARVHLAALPTRAVRQRHLAHFASLCTNGASGLETNEQAQTLATLLAYASDIDSAMRFAAHGSDAFAVWQMCGALTFVWVAAGRFAEAAEWFDWCSSNADGPVAAQLPARWGAAHLAVYSGDIERGLDLAVEARAMAQQIGATSYVARCDNTIGVSGMFTQRTRARAALHASIDTSAGIDDWCHVDSSQVLAYVDLQELRVNAALGRLESVRPLAEQLGHPPLLAWDWLGRYQATAIRGDVIAARAIEETTTSHVLAAGDTSISALLMAAQAQVACRAGRAQDSIGDLEVALERCVAQGAESAALTLLGSLIDACSSAGDFDRARSLLDGVEPELERTAPDATLAIHIQRCGLALGIDDQHGASRALVKARQVAERHGTAPGLAVVQCWEALSDLAAGRPTTAWKSALSAWPVLRVERLDSHAVGCLRILAICCSEFDDGAGAARLLGAADSLATTIGLVDEPCGSLIAASINKLTTTGDSAWTRAWAQGHTAPIDDTVASVTGATGSRRRPTTGWDALTPAERRVATLVAEGLTNRQAAERLFIGAGTVKTHLEHAYGKLGVRNRTQLTAAFHREMGGA